MPIILMLISEVDMNSVVQRRVTTLLNSGAKKPFIFALVLRLPPNRIS